MVSLTSLVSGIPSIWIWLGVAIAFALVEGLTLGIISIWFAMGALIAMLVAFVIDSFLVQLLVFLVVSLILVATTRKIAVEKLKVGQTKTNVDDLIGKEAIVVRTIEPHVPGEVKINGQFWRAVSDSQQSYEVNDIVTILRIEGVTIFTK